LATGEFTAGDARYGLTDTGRGVPLAAGAQEEPAVTLYSQSGSPVAEQDEGTYRWSDRWEPWEDILSLLAEPSSKSLDDASDPHDALFTVFGREEIR
jgi:hypothetical protein